MIAGVANGVVMGSHLATQAGHPRIPLNWLNVNFMSWLGIAGSRTFVGFVLLVVIKWVIS
jgi:hypothetical protein